jgi:hypothetical protein
LSCRTFGVFLTSISGSVGQSGKGLVRGRSGGKRTGVTGDWRKFHSEELYDFCSLPNSITMIKLRNMRWADHVARMGKREMNAGCSYGNLEERGHLEVLGVDG